MILNCVTIMVTNGPYAPWSGVDGAAEHTDENSQDKMP